MRYEVYAIYDNKAETYTIPFFIQNQPMAIRSFKDLVNTEGNQFNKNADDYALYQLGEYEDASGEFHTEGTHVTNGEDML